MSGKSIESWQFSEISSLRDAILALLLKKDSLLYVQAPVLRARYMQSIGAREQEVLAAELDTVLLRKKADSMQAAVNRREPIDMDAIEEDLEKERERLIAEVEAKDLTRNELPQLTGSETAELQKDYREIVTFFHPAMNTDISSTQRDLYEKSCEAYRRLDLASLRLLREMLLSAAEERAAAAHKPSPRTPPKGDTTAPPEEQNTLSGYAEDYSLVAELADVCALSPEETAVREKIEEYKKQQSGLMEEIERIMSGFPFNAESTLDDPEKEKAYLVSLEDRMLRCRVSAKALGERIDDIMKRQNADG